MKIITLNTWGGRGGQDFVRFLKLYADKIDVFCLQETYKDAKGKETEQIFFQEGILDMNNVFEQIFTEHHVRFDPYWGDFFGMNQIVHSNNTCRFFEPKEIVSGLKNTKHNETREKIAQYTEVCASGKNIVVANFHGLWKKGFGKGDCGERFLQSQRLIEFVNSQACPVVLCGDFNLDPEAESMKFFERETGMRNLVIEYGITDTRTRFYPASKPSRFADYVFVSPDINVLDFKVMPDVISDHAPLYLEFGI